jgi:hypothetical protein
MAKLGVGLIGLGHNGLAWCDAWRSCPLAELRAVCDRDPERLRHASERFAVDGYQDYAILDRGDGKPSHSIVSVRTVVRRERGLTRVDDAGNLTANTLVAPGRLGHAQSQERTTVAFLLIASGRSFSCPGEFVQAGRRTFRLRP